MSLPPAPHITSSMIDTLMTRVKIKIHYEGTSTFAHAFLDGKFFLGTGFSACVYPENYRKDIGDAIATGKAFEIASQKLWELEGYVLYTQLNKETPK